MTTNKKLSLTLGLVVIVVAGTTAIVQNMQLQHELAPATPPATTTASVTAPTTPVTTTSPVTTAAPDTYTLADVAQHNSASSCWTAINGNVYDVTSWINQHPGGPGPILSLCGTDGSSAFNNQHGGQARPADELATFKIGTLAQ